MSDDPSSEPVTTTDTTADATSTSASGADTTAAPTPDAAAAMAAGGDGDDAAATPLDADTGPADASGGLDSQNWLRHVPAQHLKAAGKFKSFADFVAGYADLESRLGQALFPPGADANPEALARFQERLGRPKAPAGYRAPEAPDGVVLDEGKLDLFRDKAFEIGLPQQQFEALVGWEIESQQALQVEVAQQHRRAHQALHGTWGEDAAANYEKARRVADILFDADERAALQLSQRPEDWAAPLVAALARISPSFEDHKFLARGERDIGRSDDALVDELNGLMAEPDYWQDEAKQRRARQINEALYGTKSVHPAG